MWMLLGAVMLRDTLQPEAVEAGQYHVQVSFDVRPMEEIGSLKSGFICAPAGSLRWKDVARENDQDIADRLFHEIESDDRAKDRRHQGQWTANV